MKDYYQILGLKNSATAEEIRNAYRLYAGKFHPDKHNGDKFFEERFIEIKEAFDVLSESSRRIAYDQSIGIKYDFIKYDINKYTSNPANSEAISFTGLFVKITNEYIEDKSTKIQYPLSQIKSVKYEEKFIIWTVSIGLLCIALGLYLSNYKDNATIGVITIIIGFLFIFFRKRYLRITNNTGEIIEIAISEGEKSQIQTVIARLKDTK